MTGTFVVASLAICSACTFIVDTDNVQCNVAADCVALGYENSVCDAIFGKMIERGTSHHASTDDDN